ncbi:MAG: hypothetical protein JWL61_945, partial [Gemmatimonadetes bacterium]|nr:hypothetical protein [Gemmatimonadota bacterium]
MRPRLRLTFAVMAALLASAINCGREITAPDKSTEATGPYARGLSFKTVFPEALSRSTGPNIVPFTSVRVTVRHSDNTIALDTLIAFPPTADSVAVSLNVRLLPNVPATGERLTISLQYINASNVTVFNGSAPVDVMPTLFGQDPPPPVVIPVSYSGPGANATKIVISPKSQTVTAGGTFQFTAQAFDAANNLLPGTPVVFSSSNTGLAVLPSAASGSGSTLVGRGTAQITGTLLTGPSDVGTLTVQPALSAIAPVSGSGQSAPAGTLLPTPVVVRVTATDGLGVSGVPVSFIAANGGSVTSTSVLTDANGNAQTSWTLGPAAGAQILTATASGIAAGATFTATATAVTPTALVVTQQPTTAAAGQPISNVVITAQSANGITATSFTGAISIALGTNTAGATLSGTTTVNAVAGVATFAGLTLNKTGTGFTLVASSGSLTSATTSPFDITTAPASAITVVSGGGQTGAAGATLPQPVVVSVTDVFGNPIAGQTVTFAVASGGGSVATPSVVTNALGQASTTWTLGAPAGSQTITASSGALTPLTISATATAAGGTVTTLSFSSAPSVVTAGVANSFVVQARDAQGQLVTSFTGNVTLAFGTNPSGGTLTGPPTVAAVGGVATFVVSVDKSGAGYTFVASSGTVSSSPFTFSVRPAAATSVAFTTQPSSVAAGAIITPAVVVTARDPFGNTDTTFTGTIDIAIAANPGDDIIRGTTSVSAVAGVASFSTLMMNVPAVGYTLMATSSGLSSATSTAFDVTPGVAPTALVFSSVPSAVTAGATFTPVVQARNAQGTVLTSFNGNITLALSANPAGGTLNGTTTVAAVSGIASFPGVSINKAGSGYGLVATFGNVTSSSSPLTVVPATAVDLAFTSQPSTASAGSPITPAVVVTARDAFGNTATSFTGNVSVVIGANPGNATLTGTTTVAAVAGVATFTNLSLTTAATGYTLVASASGLTSATSALFNIAAGTTMTWTNVNGGLWSVASNWSLGRVPQANDSVAITLSGTYTVTQDVPFNGGAALTIGGTSGTQTLAVSGQPLIIGGNMIVGSNGVVTPITATVTVGATLVNQGTLNPRNANLNAAVSNQGTIVWDGTGSILGTLTTSVGSTLRLQGSGNTGVSNLTISNGFTNNGTIDLTTVVSSYTDILTVTNGTLTNAPGGTITSSVGTAGSRTINAVLDNQGTITFLQPLALNKASAAHTNSGTINVIAADWTLNQSGAGASFTNTGTVTIGTGRTWTVNGGTLNLTSGQINGAGTLALAGVTANFATGFNNSVTSLALNNSILNGPGTITNASGQTQSMVNTTVNAPLVNQGLLVFDGTGSFTNS